MMTINCAVKFCKKCNAETEHYASGNCKPCSKANNAGWRARNPNYSAEHVEAIKGYSATWRKKSKDEKFAWRAANKQHIAEYNSAYRAANSESIAAHKYANADHIAVVNAEWRKSHPEVIRKSLKIREDRVKANGGKASHGLRKKLFELQNGKCTMCGLPLGEKMHMDHVIPVVAGGSSADFNRQLLHPRCNGRKGSKYSITDQPRGAK